MNRIVVSVLVVLAAAVFPARAGRPAPIKVPNTYVMMEDRATLTIPPCVAFSAIEVTDLREDTTAIGEVFKEGNAEMRAPITLEGALTDLVGKASSDVLTGAAITTKQSGAPILEVAIKNFRVTSKVAFNAEIEATIATSVTLRNAATREVCWESGRRASAENYGRAQKTLNYTQAMSQAIDLVLFSLLGDEEFSDAACACR